MKPNLWRILFVIIIGNVISETAVDPELKDKQKIQRNKYRCTRRFTPGVCIEPVISVWTFDFQIMNCTARLGCPQSRRTNRFASYPACVRRCQPLVDLYLQILTFGADNDTRFFLRESSGSNVIREGVFERLLPPTPLEPEGSAYGEDESVMASVLYGDQGKDNGVDYVGEVKDPDDFFGFH